MSKTLSVKVDFVSYEAVVSTRSMNQYRLNLGWCALVWFRIACAWFFAETAAVAFMGLSEDFTAAQIGCAVLIAAFFQGTAAAFLGIPVCLLSSFGAGSRSLEETANRFHTRQWASLLKKDPVHAKQWAERVLAMLFSFVSLFAFAVIPVSGIITTIQTPLYAALCAIAVAFVAAVLGGCTLPIWRRVFFLLFRGMGRFPSPLTLLIAGFGFFFSACGLFVFFSWRDFAVYLPWRTIIVLALTMLMIAAGSSVRRKFRFDGRRFKWIIAAAVFLYVSGGALSVFLPMSAARALDAIEDAEGPLSAAYSLLSGAADIDRDGYLPFLAQNDCAPFDPKIHPGAVDRAKDGIDQDCDGADGGADIKLRRGRHDYPANPKPKAMPVILITLDAAAAMHMELYGYERNTMPFLNEKAKEGVVFNFAFSEGPATRLSFPSILSSLHNTQVRRQFTSKTTTPWINVKNTLGTVFFKAGYRTEAAAPDTYFAEEMEWLYKGFDFVDKSAAKADCGRDKNGSQVTEAALKRLDTLKDKTKFLLWVHYTDAHYPHFLPDGAEPTFGSAEQDIYDRELGLLDTQLKTLFRGIDKRLGDKERIVALTADHGQAFDKKHEKWHQDHDLSTAVTHVPMIFWSPYGKERRSDQTAQIIDVMPTLMNMVGIAAKGPSGESLLPAIQGKPDLDRPIMQQFYLHERRIKGQDPLISLAVRKGSFVLYERRPRRYRVYDYKKDPFEDSDLAPSHPEIVREMTGIRDAFLKMVYEKWNREKK